MGVKTLDESQHAHRVLVTELAPHSPLLLSSPHHQAQAETGLRPGPQLSCGSAGQPRISTLTVGCGPGPGPRAGGQIGIIFLFFAAERMRPGAVWRVCLASSFLTDTITGERVSSTGEPRHRQFSH